jgi:hypothetical protein
MLSDGTSRLRIKGYLGRCSGLIGAWCPSGEEMRSIANGESRCVEVFEAARYGRFVVLLQLTRALDMGYVLGVYCCELISLRKLGLKPT